jgi:hypothetical protein
MSAERREWVASCLDVEAASRLPPSAVVTDDVEHWRDGTTPAQGFSHIVFD